MDVKFALYNCLQQFFFLFIVPQAAKYKLYRR